VVVIVLWAIAVAAIIASAVQLFAYRQANLGYERLNRTQARWAARAGVEYSISMMGLHTEMPVPDDAYAMLRDLEYAAAGDLHQSAYTVLHHADGRAWKGPMDEHSKININADTSALSILEDITPDQVAAINDWRDEDDDPTFMGVEREWYLGQYDYEPRNDDFRSIAEMELVAGVWPEYLRGEDWNLNGRLDPNENDGQLTVPEDNADGILDPGWSGMFTTHSIELTSTDSGEPPLYLRWADPIEVMDRCLVSEEQADALIAFSRNDENTLEQLITASLSDLAQSGSLPGYTGGDVEPLTDEQLRMVLIEATTYPLYERRPGRINLNTISPVLLRDLLELRGYEEALADELLYMRNSRVEGITSILDLLDIPDMNRETLQELAAIFTTRSSIFTIAARGRANASGIESEIIAVVDRSTVPIKILEYREQ
jgi:hypothetical protein